MGFSQSRLTGGAGAGAWRTPRGPETRRGECCAHPINSRTSRRGPEEGPPRGLREYGLFLGFLHIRRKTKQGPRNTQGENDWENTARAAPEAHRAAPCRSAPQRGAAWVKKGPRGCVAFYRVPGPLVEKGSESL